MRGKNGKNVIREWVILGKGGGIILLFGHHVSFWTICCTNYLKSLSWNCSRFVRLVIVMDYGASFLEATLMHIMRSPSWKTSRKVAALRFLTDFLTVQLCQGFDSLVISGRQRFPSSNSPLPSYIGLNKTGIIPLIKTVFSACHWWCLLRQSIGVVHYHEDELKKKESKALDELHLALFPSRLKGSNHPNSTWDFLTLFCQHTINLRSDWLTGIDLYYILTNY